MTEVDAKCSSSQSNGIAKNMNPSKNVSSAIKATNKQNNNASDRSGASVDEIDSWIKSLGGRELSAKEAAKIRAEISWHKVPSEDVPF